MKTLCLNLLVLFGVITSLTAQENVLFTVNDKPVYSTEFKHVYSKNLDLVQEKSQKDIDNYLELFINYKLKLEEAYTQGLDQKDSYKNELKGYKRQLTQKYLNDNKVTDKLVTEAYERLKTEIDANHVLVKFDENASKAQEAAALVEINKLRARVIAEGFDKVQKDVHNGKTLFAENLGYFTAFKMVYNFENAAYNTKVGEVSQPFRTRFGYHVVKVNDIRENRGEVTVAHIMLDADKQELINQLYKRLQQNEDFQSLAKQYSIDKSSTGKGGMLPAFSGGQLSSKIFENEAFNIANVGDYTKPFKTKFGWHIVKLYAKQPLKSFKDYKRELEQKVKRDSRSQVLNDQRIEKLMTSYNLTYNQPLLKDFEAGLTDAFYRGLWNVPENLDTDKPFVVIKNKTLSYKDFSNYLSQIQRRPQPKVPYKELLEKSYKDFVDFNVSLYQEEHLEDENPEYANILKEYQEGLLLFELMGSQIWNSAENDSLALKDYYAINKANYKFSKRVKAVIASSVDKKIAKKVSKLLKSGKSQKDIETLFNSEEKINVTFSSGTYELNNPAIPSKLKFKKGTSKVYKNNDAFVVVKVDSVLEPTQKTYDEARGNVMSDFQDQKEIKWITALKAKYPVIINQESLKKLKTQLNN